MLIPNKADVARALMEYRKSVWLFQRNSGEPGALARMDSDGYTLCVLMGERQVDQAVAAAEAYLHDEPNRALSRSTDSGA
ncbi:DUF5133 domain-containing protein [Streptomyces luteolus]|uniref:DUF5133 domain-containing protein n=1 Tax=Streptomyces luteolus TaxID=3043615 RepID=A0ABT6STD4_9ACTN|nr:DUF5133 domain-containing protein [Streptomyces sp. B-S-A12]MDI3418373.1 DUF5133 domain-containing protein [Streptomyces sp. B-S-A12]